MSRGDYHNAIVAALYQVVADRRIVCGAEPVKPAKLDLDARTFG